MAAKLLPGKRQCCIAGVGTAGGRGGGGGGIAAAVVVVGSEGKQQSCCCWLLAKKFGVAGVMVAVIAVAADIWSIGINIGEGNAMDGNWIAEDNAMEEEEASTINCCCCCCDCRTSGEGICWKW